MVADMIYDILKKPAARSIMIDPMDPTRRRKLDHKRLDHEDLLVPLFKAGNRVYKIPEIREIKSKVDQELNSLDKAHKRFVNPHIFPVGLEKELYKTKTDLILELRKIHS